MRNGLPEIQYLTSVEDGEERGGVERKHGEGYWLTRRNTKRRTAVVYNCIDAGGIHGKIVE